VHKGREFEKKFSKTMRILELKKRALVDAWHARPTLKNTRFRLPIATRRELAGSCGQRMLHCTKLRAALCSRHSSQFISIIIIVLALVKNASCRVDSLFCFSR
jgi:hypothetical protein